ncbi:MAG: STAS domain-containing protein [Kiritimatiellia bacterium]|jgi:anti-anti-sigma regulatory factor|nr:STAS domain-containing protein [Kiritimatiellia bacterium]
MMRPTGNQILAATVDQCTMVAVLGAGNFRLAPSFRQATQAARLAGTALIVVDMAACTALDSTFMGSLAALGLAGKQPDGTPAVLINLSAHLHGLLQGLGVSRILKTYPAGSLPNGLGDLSQFVDNLQPVETLPQAPQDLAVLMYDAHETLTRVEPENVQRFQNVLTFLRQEAGLDASPSSPPTFG